jgi:argininosuccinate lyase|tara:strand:- start:4248 stop:5675 length:1428 start_codon:yes stop_codon:yes gene_type:complete
MTFRKRKQKMNQNPNMDESKSLWHGRFLEQSADELQKLNNSISYDIRLFSQDIEGSRAHAKMLQRIGIFSEDELSEVLSALDQVEEEIQDGSFSVLPTDEDVHTYVERRITEITPSGARLHTGRSRNDQVATDLRLWTKEALTDVARMAISLQRVLLEKTKEVDGAVLPGYTHLQQAQPVPLGHHLLAHGWAISRDVERLLQAIERMDVSPLGAGAMAGSSIPLDVNAVADDLHFSRVFDNSIDAVSDRDFVADALYVLALLGVHISRIGEEVIIWSSSEFGFVDLSDSFSTGSSMMPQKKNPDVAELARGKSGRLIGNLTGFLATLKGLPLSYNKDLQEDKEPLFDAVDTISRILPAVTGMISAATFQVEEMRQQALSPYLATTDLAEWLVQRGMPFREAHAVIGGLVARSLSEGVALEDLISMDENLGKEAVSLLEAESLFNSKKTHGSASLEKLDDQIQRFENKITSDEGKL